MFKIIHYTICISLLIIPYKLFANTNECSVKGYDFINEAIKAGWAINTEITSGNGGCTFINPSVIISSNDNENLTCKISYFPDKKFVEPWKLKNVTFSGGTYSLVNEISANTDTATISINVSSISNITKSYIILDIVLVGDEIQCENWKKSIGG